MKQIAEDYVSYEVSVLLKEKGFDEEVTTFYNSNGKFEYCSFPLNHNIDIGSGFTSAPSQSLVLKWLREVHHYYIQIMLDSWACGDHLGYYVVIQKTDSDFEMMLQDAVDEVFYQTYEEACEAALKYTLENLI